MIAEIRNHHGDRCLCPYRFCNLWILVWTHPQDNQPSCEKNDTRSGGSPDSPNLGMDNGGAQSLVD
jgi:hypothetical protein